MPKTRWLIIAAVTFLLTCHVVDGYEMTLVYAAPGKPAVTKTYTLYSETDQFAKARIFCERGMAFTEKTEGPESVAMAQWLQNMAWLESRSGDSQKALQLQLRSIAIRERVFGVQDIELADGLTILEFLTVRTQSI